VNVGEATFGSYRLLKNVWSAGQRTRFVLTPGADNHGIAINGHYKTQVISSTTVTGMQDRSFSEGPLADDDIPLYSHRITEPVAFRAVAGQQFGLLHPGGAAVRGCLGGGHRLHDF
jgi:hypothetical protein